MRRGIAVLALALVLGAAGYAAYTVRQATKAPALGDVQPGLQGLESTEAWHQLLDVLEAAGDQILREGDNGAISQQDAIERYNGLLAILSNTLRLPLNRDPARPLILASDLLPALTKIGGNSPDADYHTFPVSSDYRYRLRGTRGKAPFFSIQSQSLELDLIRLQPKMYMPGVISDEQLRYDAKGRFEVLISEEKPADYDGLWLALDDKSFGVVVREYHHDREAEGEPELRVDVLDPVPTPRPFDDEEVAARLQQAAFMSRFWFDARQWYPEVWDAERVNRFPVDDEGSDERSEELALAADVQYMLGAWRLAGDEALLIEGQAPRSAYWIVQITDRWLETADFRRRQVHLNDSQIELDAAGRYRIVVAAENPGVPNWLDTGGRSEGHMAFRWAGADDAPEPSTRVVKLAALRESAGRP